MASPYALALSEAQERAKQIAARPAAPRGPDTMPRESPGEIFGSMAASGATGLRNVVESTLGLGGDLSFDTGMGFKLPLGANLLPDSEQVAAGTDWLQQQLPEGAQQPINDWTRAEAKNPFAQAAQFGTEWGVDPTNWLLGLGALGKVGKAKKVLGRADLAQQLVPPGKPPILAYRGEHGEPPPGGGFQTRLPSLSFGSKEAANTYAMSPNVHADTPHSPRVTPSHLNIQNPILDNVDDPFVDFSELQAKLGDDDLLQALARKHSSAIENTNNWEENFADQYANVEELLSREPGRINELYLDAFHLLDDPDFVAAAKAKGFDGAIGGGVGENALEPEYRIFDPSQATSPYALPGRKR